MAKYRYSLCEKGCYLRHEEPWAGLVARLPIVHRHASFLRIIKIIGTRVLSESERQSDVILPVEGTLCLRTQIGFLVLNFDRRLVYHVFSPKVDAANFTARQKMFSAASAFSFAPKLRETSAPEQWLATDYIEGREGRRLVAANERQFFSLLEERVLPSLHELATSAEVALVDADVYVTQLGESINEIIAARWPGARWLSRFVQQSVNCGARARKLALAKSHGDFVHPNLIHSKSGLWVIDWNTIDLRSLFHDIHAFVFSQIYWGPKFRDRAKLLERSLTAFASNLPAGAAAFKGADTMTAYRHCYYLERIAMKLDRRNSSKSPLFLEREISMFENFEDDVAKE